MGENPNPVYNSSALQNRLESLVLMSKSESAAPKVQVSTLRLRKKLEDLANPVRRRSIGIAPKPEPNPQPIPAPKPEPPVVKPTVIPENASAEKPKVKSSKLGLWWYLPSLLLLAEIGGVVALIGLGLINLVEPDLSAKLLSSCQGKIAGTWQTRWGTLDFSETNDGLVKGKFSYKNIDRGLIKGELSGSLDGGALKFTWQETYANKAKRNGNGVFIFGANCQEFYGSTGAVGSWQGRKLPPAPKPAKPPAPKPKGK
jgi:hypothetical protein